MTTNSRWSPEAMKARALAANSRIGERLARLWKPTSLRRFGGETVLCGSYAQWEREIARYEIESGGFTPGCAKETVR